MNLYLKKEGKWEDADKEVVVLYNKDKKRIHTETEEDIFIIGLLEEEIHKFIEWQLRKRYIRLSKSSQMTFMFFVGKKNSKKYMIWNYWYLNK